MCVCTESVYTYHSPLPDDAHPVLDSSHSMRDLCEVLFAQSSLLDAEWTVLRCHNAQSVTRNRIYILHFTDHTDLNYHKLFRTVFRGTFYFRYICVCTEHILAQQAHKEAGGVGVEAEGWDDDMGGGVSPVLVVILHPVQHRVSYCGLCVDHLTCIYRTDRKQERKVAVRRRSSPSTLHHRHHHHQVQISHLAS